MTLAGDEAESRRHFGYMALARSLRSCTADDAISTIKDGSLVSKSPRESSKKKNFLLLSVAISIAAGYDTLRQAKASPQTRRVRSRDQLDRS